MDGLIEVIAWQTLANGGPNGDHTIVIPHFRIRGDPDYPPSAAIVKMLPRYKEQLDGTNIAKYDFQTCADDAQGTQYIQNVTATTLNDGSFVVLPNGPKWRGLMAMMAVQPEVSPDGSIWTTAVQPRLMFTRVPPDQPHPFLSSHASDDDSRGLQIEVVRGGRYTPP